MTSEEKTRDLFSEYSFKMTAIVFSLLDLLLSRCNSFEDFKNGVKQTVDNLDEIEEVNEK